MFHMVVMDEMKVLSTYTTGIEIFAMMSSTCKNNLFRLNLFV